MPPSTCDFGGNPPTPDPTATQFFGSRGRGGVPSVHGVKRFVYINKSSFKRFVGALMLQGAKCTERRELTEWGGGVSVWVSVWVGGGWVSGWVGGWVGE